MNEINLGMVSSRKKRGKKTDEAKTEHLGKLTIDSSWQLNRCVRKWNDSIDNLFSYHIVERVYVIQALLKESSTFHGMGRGGSTETWSTIFRKYVCFLIVETMKQTNRETCSTPIGKLRYVLDPFRPRDANISLSHTWTTKPVALPLAFSNHVNNEKMDRVSAYSHKSFHGTFVMAGVISIKTISRWIGSGP